MRSLGYQVHSASGTTGGYPLGAGAALPPLLLDEEEAIGVAVGLHAAAIRDREGLRFDYLDQDGTASRRRAEPHRLVFTFLSSLEVAFTVIEPPELRELLAALAARYRPRPGNRAPD